MEKIVIFYSFEGNTKLIAENIAKTIGADLLELKLKKEMKSKGFMKYFWGGKAAIMKKALNDNQILGEIDFQDPLKRATKNNIQKANDWAKNIIKGL